jgi:hypothetical protein
VTRTAAVRVTVTSNDGKIQWKHLVIDTKGQKAYVKHTLKKNNNKTDDATEHKMIGTPVSSIQGLLRALLLADVINHAHLGKTSWSDVDFPSSVCSHNDGGHLPD